MKLIELRIKNYRSIKDSGDIRVRSFQALVGENNSGKSNILSALEVFLTSGSGGITEEDFNAPQEIISITATFAELTNEEKKPPLRKYLLGDKLILEKQIFLQADERSPDKKKPKAEYHGYLATPKDWWLSIEEIKKERGESFKGWKELAKEKNLEAFVTDPKGNVNKSSFEKGLAKYLEDHPEVEYEEPVLGETQALGLQPALLDALPTFHLLPAITDYTDETDKRSSSSNFRKLMSDLSDRLMKRDPRYQEVSQLLERLTMLLNPPKQGEEREDVNGRLAVLGAIESGIQALVAKMMPSVSGIRMQIAVEQIKDIVSSGVELFVDDGKETDVLRKGHGLQRCLVFALLQALVMNQRGQLVPQDQGQESIPSNNIILGIEEPELYLHPQLKRFIYRVLEAFSINDQVIYTTHDPSFVDVAEYERIGLVKKVSLEIGTTVTQCGQGLFDSTDEKKAFQFLNSFDVRSNEMFFARRVVLVEGEQDEIGLVAIGRYLELFREFPEEIDFTIISAGNKEEIPKFMRLLNAYSIPYVVLHELDGRPLDQESNKRIIACIGTKKRVEVPRRVEDAAGYGSHFGSTHEAKMFFANPKNVGPEYIDVVKSIFAIG